MQTITIEEIRRIARDKDVDAIRDIASGRLQVNADTARDHGLVIRSETRYWVDYLSDDPNPIRSGAPNYATHGEALTRASWLLLRKAQEPTPAQIAAALRAAGSRECQLCLDDPCMCSPVQRLSWKAELAAAHDPPQMWDPLRREQALDPVEIASQ